MNHRPAPIAFKWLKLLLALFYAGSDFAAEPPVLHAESGSIKPSAPTADSGAGVIGNQTSQVYSMSDLRATVPSGAVVELLGYYLAGDGGGGYFIWNPASSLQEDGGMVVGSSHSLTGRWLRQTGREIDPRWFGARGDGKFDDTAAITAAFKAATMPSPSANSQFPRIGSGTLFIPPGNFVFNGPSLSTTTGLSVAISGTSKEVSHIHLADGTYFLTTAGSVYDFTLEKLHFSGGAGVWRNLGTHVNVQGQYHILDNDFSGYQECAISSLAPDMPYFKIRDNVFYGTTNSLGIALGGAADLSEITGNSFLLDRCHIKLANGGNNVKISTNDFIRFTNGPQVPALTDLWIVPGKANVNSGNACLVYANKFGNENFKASDYKILVADSAPGSSFASLNPSTEESSGYWVGPLITNNYIASASLQKNGFIHSYTRRVFDFVIKDNFWTGGMPQPILQLDPIVRYASEARNEDLSMIDLTGISGATETLLPPAASRPGQALITDPFSLQQDLPQSIASYPIGFDANYSDLLPNGNVSALATTLGTAIEPITDSTGGTNAVQINFGNASGAAYRALNPVDPGRRAWLEFDMMKSETAPADSLCVTIAVSDQSQIALKRFLHVSGQWQTIRIPWVPRQATDQLLVYFSLPGWGNDRHSVRIGRLRIYHANEGVNPASRYLENLATCRALELQPNAVSSTTVSVIGAEPGDFVACSYSADLEVVSLTGGVSRKGLVNVHFINLSAKETEVPSGTLRVRILKPSR